MFTKRQNVLKSILEQAEKDQSLPILVEVAYRLVKFAPNYYTVGGAVYSDEEKEQAIKLLKANGLGKLCNLSQRCKKQTLALIEQAKRDLEKPKLVCVKEGSAECPCELAKVCSGKRVN